MKKLFSLIFSLCVTVMMIHAQTATAPSGSGTSGDPYQIATVNNLYWLSQNSTYWSSYYKQTANIDASSISNFSPIGNGTTKFTGTYNGYGYTISGLTESRTTAYSGLFGYINGGIITNLGVVNASISCYSFSGILIGYSLGASSVTQCFATGTISSTGGAVGGLIGEIDATSTLNNCYSICTVSSTVSGNFGGLVGYNQSGTVITNCYSSSTVSASGNIGGLVGNSGTVSSNSYYNSNLCSNGSAYATPKSATELQTQSTFSGWDFSATWEISSASNGGYPSLLPSLPSLGDGSNANPYQIATLNNLRWLSVTSSVWSKYFIQTADIDASSTSTWNSGSGFSPVGNSTTKFTGQYNGNGHTITNLTISRSTTDYIGLFGYIGSGATVTSLGVTATTITGQNNVGILAGYNSGTISSCYTGGTITGVLNVGGFIGQSSGETISRSYSSTTVNGNNNVAGFIGNNNSSISYCYATGNSNGGTSSSNYTSGGLVGYNGSSISNCYATGNVTGYSPVGSLAASNAGTITNCYCTGSITSSATSKVGGFTGNGTGSITSGFYNKDIFTGTTSYGTGKTTLEMKTLGTFINAGWDFIGESANGSTDTWALSSSDNNGYPCFINAVTASLVTTQAATTTSSSSVTGNGTIIYLSKNAPTAYGFCWSSTNTLPTVSDSKTDLGAASVTGAFTAPITGLSSNTVYYLCAYASNSSGTNYGNMVVFSTGIKGSGTQADPYQIACLADLKVLSDNPGFWGNNFIQTADIDATETSTWNSGSGFSPIGNSTTKFTGQYNGNGHTITNLTISRSTTDYIGLFGYIGSGAAVTSLGVTATAITGQNNVGVLAGYNSGTISSCNTGGTVTGGTSVGGFAGQNSAGTISQSHSSTTVNGANNVAGFIGKSANGSISYCYATGNSNGGTSSSNYTSGGLIGYNGSSISNCYATGNVTGYSPVGGLAASNDGTVTNCYCTGSITSSATSKVGGFTGNGAGSITSGFYNKDIFTGTTSYGTGKTTLEMKTLGTFTTAGWDFIGESANGSTDTWALSSLDNTGYPCFINAVTASLVTTQAATTISSSSLTGNGTIIYLSKTFPTAYGFCWSSTNTLPTVADDKTDLGAASATGVFTAPITGLTPNTTYYIRAFATNSVGTSYGDVVVIGVKGSGTQNDPYQIATLVDLCRLSQDAGTWNKYFIQTADIDATETSTWNSGSGFSPIGNSTTRFTGQYNGNGYTITNLTISRSTTDYIGLFGYIGSGATVTFLGVTATAITGQNYVGVLAGYNSGTISSCNTGGTVTGGTSVGGFIGTNSGGTISKSYSTAATTGNKDVGAFVGDNGSSGKISYCYATGNSNGGTSSSNYTSGGLVGYNSSGSSISNCYATGNVTGYSLVGGLAGSNAGTITNCYCTGSITSSATSNVGGFAGSSSGTITSGFYNKEVFTGTTSYGTGKTTAELKIQSTFTASGWDFIGETANGTNDNWAVASTVNNGYPCFVWFVWQVKTPIITTQAVSDITGTTATGNGNILSLGIANPTAYGVCWSTTQGAETATGNFVNNGVASATGAFTASITSLSINTTYYVKAYATNSTGTAYGDEVSFTTSTDNSYTITYNLNGGTNNAANTATYTYGVGLTVSNPTRTGYTFSGWYDNVSFAGTAVTAISASATGDVTLYAKWTINTYTISASAGNNGNISPSGEVIVTYGNDQTFTITANTGYHIADVLVDGTSVGAITNYTFGNVTANHTIVASFVETTAPVYTITASAGNGGSISPSGAISVEEGNGQIFTITANTGYHITDVLVDGTSGGAVSSYTFSNVTVNHTIVASFELTTGMEETNQTGVVLYPNPCQNSFIVNVGGETTILYLYDVNGKLALSQPMQGKSTVDVSSLNKGIYVVKIDGRSYKLIKTH